MGYREGEKPFAAVAIPQRLAGRFFENGINNTGPKPLAMTRLPINAAHALLEYYSVRLSKNRHPYVSMPTDYLYTLTNNLTSQSAHLNYAVLP